MADGDVEALRAFRAGLIVAFGRRRDALIEVIDGLLTAGAAPSLPHLSLAPGHRRGWGSVYAALRRGHVHADAFRSLLLRQPMPDGPPLYAMDVSVWPRPGAATSPERGYQYHSPRRRDGRDPVVPGWAYQWLTRLSWDRDSWTAPMDVRRVRPEEKPTAVAVAQLQALLAARPAARRGEVPLVVFDAGSDACGFTHALADTPVTLLIRLRSNRHFWCAPVRTTAHPRGRPRRHGARFVCNDPATWPEPTAELHVTDEAYGQVQVRAWAGLHTSVRRPVRPGVVGQYRGPRRLSHGTVVRLEVARLPGRRRTPDVVWLWWQPPPNREPRAPAPEELDVLWRGYCRRADLEVVRPQVTKPGVGAGFRRGHHVADLDVAVGHDDPVDEQLHQLPALLEGRPLQAHPESVADGRGGAGDGGDLDGALALGRHFALAGPQLALALPQPAACAPCPRRRPHRRAAPALRDPAARP